MAYNTLRSPHCDDCPGCRTCVRWMEDFDLYGSRPLATGEVEPVSWTGFALTAGTPRTPSLPSVAAIESQAAEGFTVGGGFGAGFRTAKVLTTTGTGTVAITSPVTKAYRARVIATVGSPVANVELSLTAGLAKIVAYKMDTTDAINAIAKLYVSGELKALITFAWPTTGGQWQLCLDIYDHSRTGSMAYGYFSDGTDTRELFAACPCAGADVTFAVEANPDGATIDVSYLELLAHNSEAGDAASCPQPEEPCTAEICGRHAEDWQTVLVELPEDCGDGGYFYGSGVSVEAVAWGTSARDGNTRWEWWDEAPATDELYRIRVERELAPSGYLVDLTVSLDYWAASPACDWASGNFLNFDPDTIDPLAPDACYCRWPPLTNPIQCEATQAWDFDCAAVSWNAYKCWCVASPCACAVRTIVVTPLAC